MILRTPSELKSAHSFCSRSCQARWQKEKWKTVKCANCKKKFSRRPSLLKDRVNFFCTKRCYLQWRKRNNISVLCANCGKTLSKTPVEQKQDKFFCSNKCQGEWQAKNWKGKNHPGYKNGKAVKVLVRCSFCGKKIFKASGKAQEQASVFCSRDCMRRWQSEHWKGEGSPNFGKHFYGSKEQNPNFKSILIKCSNCGKAIYKKPSKLKAQKKFFCSRECQAAWQRRNWKGKDSPFWKGGPVKAKCNYCGKIIFRGRSEVEAGPVYCSTECSKKRKSEKMTREGNYNWRGPDIEVSCSECGKVLYKRPHQARQEDYFCSSVCMGKWISKNRVGENSHNWKNGSSSLPYPKDWTEILKEFVRLRDGRKCQLCSCSEAENLRKLAIHHIDRDKENCGLSNLISLCGDCHGEMLSEAESWAGFLKFKATENLKRLEAKIQLNELGEEDFLTCQKLFPLLKFSQKNFAF